MIFGSYGPVAVNEKRDPSIAQDDAGIDPIQTAAIIPGVFGSVALSMRNFPVSARWAPVYKAIVECTAGSACERKNSTFAGIVEAARDKRFIDKLSFVNSSINRAIAYKKDSVVYGKLDYWAKPSEILERRAGDCEDFAILKMAALLHAGIPAQSMSLVVLQATAQPSSGWRNPRSPLPAARGFPRVWPSSRACRKPRCPSCRRSRGLYLS